MASLDYKKLNTESTGGDPESTRRDPEYSARNSESDNVLDSFI